MRPGVFLHELAHVLAVWLVGGKVTAFSAGENGTKVGQGPRRSAGPSGSGAVRLGHVQYKVWGRSRFGLRLRDAFIGFAPLPVGLAVITQLTDACGRGYLPTGFAGDPAEVSAYSITSGNCAVGNLTFTHEVGHNLCAHHDPANATDNPCGADSHGHFSTVEQLRTVMSYAYPYNGCQECTRIPYFSNPNIAYNGWTTGITDERNNSRVIGEWAPTIAAYRTPTGDDGSCQVTYSITNTWPGNVQVELEVANNTATYINGWTAEWTFIGDENVYNSWGVTVSQTGAQVTATGTGFGAQIPPGSSVTVGFQASVTGSPTVPASITCTI